MDRILSHQLFHLNHAGLATDQPAVPLYGGLGWNYSVKWASVGNYNAENLAQLGFAAQLIQSNNLMPNLVGEIVPLSLARKRG